MIDIGNYEKRIHVTEETIHVDVMDHTTHMYRLDDGVLTASDHRYLTDKGWDILRTDGVVTHVLLNGDTINRVTYYNIDIMNEEIYYSLLNICNIPVQQWEEIQTTLHRNSDGTVYVTLHNAIDDDIDDKHLTFPSLSVIVSLISDDVVYSKHDRIVTFLNTLSDDNIEEDLKWS